MSAFKVRNYKIILIVQSISLLLVSAIFYTDPLRAVSAGIGSLGVILISSAFALFFFRKGGTADAKNIATNFGLAIFAKFVTILSLVMLLVFFRKNLDLIGLAIGFFASYIAYLTSLMALLFLRDQKVTSV